MRLKSAIAQLDGDDFAIGVSAGLLWEPVAGTRLVAAYHSGVDLDTSGTQRNLLLGGVSVPLSAQASLPAMVQLGVTQAVTPELTVMAEARWIGWESFRRMVFEPGAGRHALRRVRGGAELRGRRLRRGRCGIRADARADPARRRVL